ncbi:Uncharacterised protein [Delftia tsuruhatensis]|uniref:hypothetical protein n=1 Tax=Delftia tsuruhatensis TaxID=180282 RepID=UPI001E7C8477|nr:hypothetical protein [Delftia tsuruhatensis]CAB5715046.1 Uncharacterised protein [Delftia tsuruhatensis]CAC9676634.1 Uncharacterised protein [Delftia tsuruhatensis]
MTMVQLTRRSAALLLLGSLAACGGGGGGGGGEPGGGDPGTPGNPGGGTPTPVTGQYRMETAAGSFDAALSAMNALGAQGYAFTYTLASGGASFPAPMGDFYVSDTAHAGVRLDYRMVGDVAGVSALVAQLNQQGAQGYLYKSGMAFPDSTQELRNLYVRSATAGSTYSYETRPAVGALDTTGFTQQLAEMSGRGFRYTGPLVSGNDMFNLYVKDSRAPAFEYAVFALAAPFGMASGAALKQRLDEMGAKGHLLRGALVLRGNTEGVQLYEKSGDQQGAIEYRVEPVSSSASLAQRLAQFNRNAAEGFFAFGDVVTDDGQFHAISVRNVKRMVHPLAGASFP